MSLSWQLSDNASILHYQLKSSVKQSGPRSLLLDAAASFAGYAADITRTYSCEADDFQTLVGRFDDLQRHLVSLATVGTSFEVLQDQAVFAIGDFMIENQLATGSPDELDSAGVIEKFYPHALSHFVGLQVHDPGGRQLDQSGAVIPPGKRFVSQNQKQLDERMVFTVEPGIYFNQQNLDLLRSTEKSKLLNWGLIDYLANFGGIRVEDNVLLTNNGISNLTRKAFS